MSRFRRELRYLVFKLKDIDRYLSPREREMLVSIENKIIAARDKERRPQLSTVVVERDWPEFEIVWGLLEARMLGVKNKYEVEIKEIQTELSEQCRLLGMSAERELKLIAEIERQKARYALLEEPYSLLCAEIETMRDKINELHAQIQKLISERNAFGLAIDRALSGIVPDEHPLRSRLVEIAAMHAKFEAMRKQEPVAWQMNHPSLGDGWIDTNEAHAEWLRDNKYGEWKVRPLYLAPGAQSAHDPSAEAIEHALKAASGFTATWSDAQTAPTEPDGWQPIETAPKDGTHVLLANKTGTRVADGMYGNYKVWSWPYVMVEPAYWRPMPAAPGAQEK